MSFNGIYKLSPKYDLHKYIDSLPVGSEEYWGAIALLSNPQMIKPLSFIPLPK
jgi:hypothetical protein